MNSMFGPETKFFKVTNQIGNILLVSVLWLIGCIPVITIGTSTIAMYYAMVKAVRCEEGYVTKEFFPFLPAEFKDRDRADGYFSWIGSGAVA
ncbi:MAG: DUF624 domain-containing protein [Roseburia sp.]